MPINEILAPSYLRITYQTWASRHRLTLYLNGIMRMNPDPLSDDKIQIELANDPGFWWTVETNVYEMIRRVYFWGNATAPVIENIEAWNSVPGGVNTFVGYGAPRTIASKAGATNGVAASYHQYRYRTVDATSPRQQMQVTLFECTTNSAPQRTASPTPPDTDNTTPEWQVVKGMAGWFTSQDGYYVNNTASLSVGYNRKLARSYGRRLTP